MRSYLMECAEQTLFSDQEKKKKKKKLFFIGALKTFFGTQNYITQIRIV